MNTPEPAVPEKSLHADLNIEAELSKLVNIPEPTNPGETNAARISSSVARLTSNSIEELDALTSELKRMQEFLRSEVEGVQRQIDSALAGISIIIDTITPWKSPAVSAASPTSNTRVLRAGLAANIDSAQRRQPGTEG